MTKSAGPALHALHAHYGDRVQFATLYVREAHPGDRYVQPQDEATKTAQALEPQDESRLRPMLSGMGEMWSALVAAGPVAVCDVAVHAPPMALTAALAGRMPFRSPLARGATAAVLLAAAPVTVAALLRSRRR